MKTGKQAFNEITELTFWDIDNDFLEKDAQIVVKELDVLHQLGHAFSDRVLNAVLPKESVKIIQDYINGLFKTHPELKQVLENYSKVSFYDSETSN